MLSSYLSLFINLLNSLASFTYFIYVFSTLILISLFNMLWSYIHARIH